MGKISHTRATGQAAIVATVGQAAIEAACRFQRDAGYRGEPGNAGQTASAPERVGQSPEFAAIVRGMNQITCEYCGSVIRL